MIRKIFECDIGGHQILTNDLILVTLMKDQSLSEDHGSEEDFSDEERNVKWP